MPIFAKTAPAQLGEGKQSFFEKKGQKTFVHDAVLTARAALEAPKPSRQPWRKSFLVLFFKKGLLALSSLPQSRHVLEIDIDADIEQSLDSFHAYAVPDGIDIRPGDVVLVHGMPNRLKFGDRRIWRTRATVTRAGWLRRAWTEFAGLFELTELYEVGFMPAHELALRPRDMP